MRSLSGRPRLAAALAALILVTGTGAATATTAHRLWGTDSQGRIHGCVSKKTGVLRVASSCARGERALLWNQQGPVGAPGTPGEPGQPGEPGVVGSLDQLDGTSCDHDGGVLDVTYGADGRASLTCLYSGTVSLTKGGSDLPSVSTDSGLSCPSGQHACTSFPVPAGHTVTFTATLPQEWAIARFAPAPLVPGWSQCDSASHDYTGVPWTATCQRAAPIEMTAQFGAFRTWYVDTMSAMTASREQQVEQCAHDTGTLVVCSAGSNGIDPDLVPDSGPVATLSVGMTGVITVTTAAPPTTYIRTPTLQFDGTVTWATTGTCAGVDLC